MAWASKINTKSPVSKLILMMIANYANEKGEAYPSQDHLAKICQCSKRSIVRHIQELEKQKFISIRKEKNGAYGFNLYKLNIRYTPDWHLTNDRLAHNTQDKQIISNFENWWAITPRKIGKKKAKSIKSEVEQKIEEVTEQELIEGMTRYAESVKNTETEFIVHPSTFLSQGRWEDQIEVKVKNKNWLAG